MEWMVVALVRAAIILRRHMPGVASWLWCIETCTVTIPQKKRKSDPCSLLARFAMLLLWVFIRFYYLFRRSCQILVNNLLQPTAWGLETRGHKLIRSCHRMTIIWWCDLWIRFKWLDLKNRVHETTLTLSNNIWPNSGQLVTNTT